MWNPNCGNCWERIVERELFKEYYEKQRNLDVYTCEGYEIYRDFSDEVKLNEKIQKVYMYVKYNSKNYKK